MPGAFHVEFAERADSFHRRPRIRKGHQMRKNYAIADASKLKLLL